MLTNFINSIIDFGFNFINSAIPDTSKLDQAFENVADSIDTVITWIHNVNYFIPLDTCLIILGIEVSIQVVLFMLYFTDKVRRVTTSFIP